jgi:hypothetical protein
LAINASQAIQIGVDHTLDRPLVARPSDAVEFNQIAGQKS